jgi:hypothetical protein
MGAEKGNVKIRRKVGGPQVVEGNWLAHWTISQLVAAGPRAPRKGMKIMAWAQCGAGSGEVEISHGATEAEQLCDPERA